MNKGCITNIGSWERQYPYKETKFYEFDQILFASWRDKPDGKGKDEISFGVPIEKIKHWCSVCEEVKNWNFCTRDEVKLKATNEKNI